MSAQLHTSATLCQKDAQNKRSVKMTKFGPEIFGRFFGEFPAQNSHPIHSSNDHAWPTFFQHHFFESRELPHFWGFGTVPIIASFCDTTSEVIHQCTDVEHIETKALSIQSILWITRQFLDSIIPGIRSLELPSYLGVQPQKHIRDKRAHGHMAHSMH